MARPVAAKDSLGYLAGYTDVFTLTPHATNEMPANRGFMVDVAGNVAIRGVDSTADQTLTVLAGVWYPISIKYLRVSGTTATGIHGGN